MTEAKHGETPDALSQHIARHIFALGSEPNRHGGTAQRIQFMGGSYPKAEIPLGGLCEGALARAIAVAIANFETTP